MTPPDIIDRLDEILELLASKTDHGRTGLTEARRRAVERLVKALRDEVSRSDD
jgi:hypothetical protein